MHTGSAARARDHHRVAGQHRRDRTSRRCSLTGRAAVLTLLAGMLMAAGPRSEPYPFVPEPVTQPRFAPVTVPTQHTIARDGVELAADVYMPDTSAEPDWKQPVILVFGPYKDAFAGVPYRPIEDLAPRYTARGFTVVDAAMRGTSGSGG